MTDTLHAPAVAPALPPEMPPPRRNPALTALSAVAVAAVLALGIVAVVAINDRDGGTTTMMAGTGMSSSMMGNGQMMNGSMMGNGQMNGPMMGRSSSSPTIPGAREIAVTASAFKFAPNEIHVRAGEDATIVLAATDLAHDFTVDELGLHVAASPGQPGRGSFHAPSAAGRYTAYCSVAGHRQAGMTATVVIDES